MNDPGLHEPVAESQDKIEDTEQEDEHIEGVEQSFLNPSRWWFASTAFPLLAGTFGPMATAFNICALVEHWRVEIPPGLGANESHGIDVRDPKWLLAVNGVSLGLAIIANFSLLLNMARRLSFPVAQPITIIGWYLSSILLIADIASIIHIVKVPGQRRALTQAFYYAIFAAVLYFIIATLMVFTVIGAWRGHYSKEFKLNTSQRTLMLQTISFMIYMVGGAGVYAKIEGWMFLDSVYFTNYTLLTVGIGDYAPSTHLGRGLLFPYAIGGILILGLVIGSIRSLVLQRGKKKLGKRMVEKKRELLLKRMSRKDQTDKLNPIHSKDQAEEVGMSERERREAEFKLMREIQNQASTRQKWQALFISGSAWLILWLIGAVVFYKAEYEQQWSYFQSLYFAYTTLLTIGYGDYVPYSNSGKAFFVFWSLLAVPTLTIVISNMGDTVVKFIGDLTLYLGEFTVLPGDAPLRYRVKKFVAKTSGGRLFGDALGLAGFGEKIDSEKGNEGAGATDLLASQVEDEELKEARQANLKGDKLREDIHSYHFLLIKEVRNVLKHLEESPPRKYDYDEWAWFLKLMGEDESHSASHRTAPIKVKNNTDGKPDMQQAQTDDMESGLRQWSWLGNRSPLMGDSEEAEWVLERLSMTLEKELKKLLGVKTENENQDRGENTRRIHSNRDSSTDDSDETLKNKKGGVGVKQSSDGWSRRLKEKGTFSRRLHPSLLSAAGSRHLIGPSSVSSPNPRLSMGLLQPRAASVSRSTYVATTVLLVLWIITFGAIIVYLLRRLGKGASRFERPVTIDRSASSGSTAPHVPPDPIRRTEDLSRRTPTASPVRNLVPAAPSSTAARQQTLLARQPSQAAIFARLQAMPLASDTTDMSNETAETPRETVNASYMAMLAQRGIDARDHALVGSDDSTDAGAGAEGAMSYALRARGLVVGGLSAGMEMEPARFLGRGGHGRAMTYG